MIQKLRECIILKKCVALFIVLQSFSFTPIYSKTISYKSSESSPFASYLKNDTCTYDDQNNTVFCVQNGVFQNIKKVCAGAAPAGSQVLGSIVGDDGKDVKYIF